MGRIVRRRGPPILGHLRVGSSAGSVDRAGDSAASGLAASGPGGRQVSGGVSGPRGIAGSRAALRPSADRLAAGVGGGGFSKTMKIQTIRALQILDSRGNPTLSVQVELEGSIWGEAKVPSGASTGKHEAVELRDAGEGVGSAMKNGAQRIAPALHGMDAPQHAAVD